MSQNSLFVNDGSGAVVLAALNNALNSLATQNSGASAPTTTYPFMFWADTANGLLKQRDSSNASWVTIGALSENLGMVPLSGANMTGAINDGYSVVAATVAAPDIWTGTANRISFSDTVNVTGFSNAPQPGSSRKLHCVGAYTFVNSANLICPGGANYTTTAGDVVEVVAITTSQFRLSITKQDGTPVVSTSVSKQIQPVGSSVASNALTLTLNPTSLDFRSATLGSGTVNTRTVGSARNLTVPSSATLGTVNGQPARLALLALDNAGTVELAICNLYGSNLDESTLISTTAISAAATANNVIYSATARTNVPFRVVGIIDSTQTTAGTWAAAPTMIQGAGGDALKHVGQFQSATVATTSGTQIDVTGIPDWVNRVTILKNAMVVGSNSTVSLQLGAGSIQASGYTYQSMAFSASAVATTAATSAASIPVDPSNISSLARAGYIRMQRVVGTNRWQIEADSYFDSNSTAGETRTLGHVTLSGTLDRIRLLSSSVAFSGGSINVIWE